MKTAVRIKTERYDIKTGNIIETKISHEGVVWALMKWTSLGRTNLDWQLGLI